MAAATRNTTLNYLLGAFLVTAFVFALADRRPQVRDVDVSEAKALIENGAVVIDVRELEVSAGSHIAGALLIPLGILAQRMTELSIDKTRPVVVYCNEGTSRGPEGTAAMNQAGFAHAVNLKSGIEGWRAAGMPTSSN